jgi:putative transposase
VIVSRQSRLAIDRCCFLLNVSRACFYKDIPEPKPEDKAVQDTSRRFPFYGYRRLCLELGESPKVTRRLMRRAGIRARCRGRFKPTTTLGSSGFEGKNLWRNKRVSELRTVLGSDVTFVNLGKGFAYIAVTLDLCSRKILGYAISRSNDTELTLSCLNRCGSGLHRGWYHPSDRGSNYTSNAFLQAVALKGGRSSFSRAARPYDNAIVERFFSTLKFEGLPIGSYSCFQSLKSRLDAFVKTYNQQRRHSRLAYQAPDQYEEGLATRTG